MSVEPGRPVTVNMALAAAVLNKASVQVLDMPVTFRVGKFPSLYVMYGGTEAVPSPSRKIIQMHCHPYKWMPAENYKLAQEVSRVTINAQLQVIMDGRQLLTIRPGVHELLKPAAGLSLAASYNDLVTRVQAVLTDMGERSATLGVNVSINMSKLLGGIFDSSNATTVMRELHGR